MGVRRSAEEARPWGGEIVTRLPEPPDRLSRAIATSVILSLHAEKHFQLNFVVRVNLCCDDESAGSSGFLKSTYIYCSFEILWFRSIFAAGEACTLCYETGEIGPGFYAN